MPWNEGILNYKANETLEAHRRVKIDTSATTAKPVKVVYADVEDYVGVTLNSAATGDIVAVAPNNIPGTLEIECKIGAAINVGTLLYAAADGKVTDTASGTAQGVSLIAAAASNEHIEVAPWNVKSTTAATVSVADGTSIITGTTVEAALVEIFKDAVSIQNCIPIPLYTLREVTAALNVANGAGNGGVLASDTTPILSSINGATDGCQVVKWAAGNADPVAFQVALPPHLNDAADVVLHARVACTATATDIPSITMASYFNEGDTAVADTMAASGATTTFGEVTGTIAHADVPAGAQTITCKLTPGTHASSAWSLSALWLEYKSTVLTS
jgi:hypothetical protein